MKVVDPQRPVPPTLEYLDLIVRGAKFHQLPAAEAQIVIARAVSIGLDLPDCYPDHSSEGLSGAQHRNIGS